MLRLSFRSSGQGVAPGAICRVIVSRSTRPSPWSSYLGLLVISGALFTTPAPVHAIPGQQGATPNLIEQATELQPRRQLLAHLRFCLVYVGQCDIRPDRRDPSRSLQSHWDEAMRVNLAVNRAIQPKADEEFDSWDIHVTEGDCEDYALQKQADLIALGWPTDHLRLAITRTRKGVPHAVLLVRIGNTDYVLDNLTPRIVPWNKTGYRFLMLQDRHDPNQWHDVIAIGSANGTS